jgi:hypothetical protein
MISLWYLEAHQPPANRSSLLYTLDVEVPTKAHATVVVPTVVTAGRATIHESRGAVWAAGRFGVVAGLRPAHWAPMDSRYCSLWAAAAMNSPWSRAV